MKVRGIRFQTENSPLLLLRKLHALFSAMKLTFSSHTLFPILRRIKELEKRNKILSYAIFHFWNLVRSTHSGFCMHSPPGAASLSGCLFARQF